MKKLLQILFLSALYLTTASSQDRIHRGVIPDKPFTEKLREIQKSNTYGLQRLNDLESLLLKSKSSNWRTVLRNPQREFYEEERFDAKDTRTTINKTLLGNGFLLIEEIFQTWNGSWVDSSKISYTYDGNNNLTEELGQGWDGSAWVNGTKYSYTYNGNNNRTEWLYQGWDGSAWVNGTKYSYTYNGNNNRTEELWQNWDGSVWVNMGKSACTYDGNNNRIEELWQAWDGSVWVNYSNNSYTYDGNNNLTEWLFQDWDGSVWVNNSNDLFTYDGNNNLTVDLYQFWDGFDWVNTTRFSYTYDGNNNMTEDLWQTSGGSVWVNFSKGSYTYDGNNSQTVYLYQMWNNSAWENDYKISYSYMPVTEVNENLSSANSYSLSNNYPNPFNPTTKINYQLPQSVFVALKVYDILGKEVATLVNEYKPAGKYDIEFSATDGLPSGVYFYQLKAGDFVHTKKMILLK